MKILGLIDSFKGSLSSIELGEILINELTKKNIEIDYIPISDGGEGFLDFIEYLYKLRKQTIETKDALGRSISSYYLVDDLKNIAYIELAKTAGLNLLKEDEYNPFITSTYSVGEVILQAINNGSKNIVIGLGGSCTNDGGSGILEALGVKFYDKAKLGIKDLCNRKLKEINQIDTSIFMENISGISFSVINDVKNVLLGRMGASYIFAKQKGARESELELLDRNLAHYAKIIETNLGVSFKMDPGSGAAGGAGFAFASMFKSKMLSGIDYVLGLIDFENKKYNYDYIITGEGKIDSQSLAGKVVFEITKRAYPINVIALCGINELLDNHRLFKIYSIVNEKVTKECSLRDPKKYFSELVNSINFHRLNQEKFKMIIATNEKPLDKGIGTLGEKSLHRFVKKYLDYSGKNQEIKIGSYYVDIFKNNEIIEIQTRNFNSLRAKLLFLLKDYVVTVCFPTAHKKVLKWLAPDSFTIEDIRKSPRLGSIYDVFSELYKIKFILSNPKLKIKIILFDIEEYRLLNGYSANKKRGSYRYDQIPLELIAEIDINNISDYQVFIPKDLQEEFTSSDYSKKTKITKKKAQIALNVLKHLGVIELIGKDSRSNLYCITNLEKDLSL